MEQTRGTTLYVLGSDLVKTSAILEYTLNDKTAAVLKTVVVELS